MLPINHFTLREAFAVYKVDADFEPNKPFFIGCCPLANIAHMQDAWTYQTFVDQIKDGRAAIRLTVLGVYATRDEAEPVQVATVAIHNVWCNLKSERCEQVKPGARGNAIRNVETGMRYNSASEVAKVLGVTNAAVSQHLSGKLPHIKNQRFERVQP